MSRPLRADVFGAGSTNAPNAGAGYAADVGSLYLRQGTSQIWQKFGALDTDWILVTPAYREIAVSGAVLATDEVVVVTGYATTIALSLPSAATVIAGRRFTIKDGQGDAASLPITVTANGADTIDGDNAVVIQLAYGSIDLVADGVSAWFIV